MVAGMKSSLAAKGVDVAEEISKGSLVLSAEQGHLVEGHFCVEGMIQTLEATLLQARKDGYKGLWATGDMTWEFGPLREFATILQYEWRLEEFFRTHPDLYGICQYHRDTLPAEVVHNGLLSHRSIFINETLSRINPFYVPPESFTEQTRNHGDWENMISNVCQS